MSLGRVVSGVVASVAVAGCAVVVIGIGRADSKTAAQHQHRAPTPVATTTQPTTEAPAAVAPAGVPATTGAPAATIAARPAPAAPIASPVSVPSALTSAVAAPVTHAAAPHPAAAAPATHAAPARHRAAAAPARPAAPRGVALPLRYSTGNATRVITVTASSHGSTTATLQPWVKQPGGGWKKQGSAVRAHIGADGMSTHPSESRSATPIGSFTLTEAFGYYRNPGTRLPYFTTTLSDYWISSPGRLYNTHQRCGSCGYNNGVNERLATELPFYNYAVVIDYNTRNAPGGVHQGAGSAFFLHVTDGSATAGCVAIPQSRLVPIMRWLTPGAHPRILIGVT